MIFIKARYAYQDQTKKKRLLCLSFDENRCEKVRDITHTHNLYIHTRDYIGCWGSHYTPQYYLFIFQLTFDQF